MKKSVKGALLSAVIFPGVGQLWLKRYLLGATLLLAVSASFAVIVVKSVHHALTILERAETEGGTVDMVAVVNMARDASSAANDPTTRWAVIVMALCWIIGTVDAYFAGKKEEEAGHLQR